MLVPRRCMCALGPHHDEGRANVLEGSGEASGADGVDEPIGPGEVVFLHEGEDHELKSEAGLTALIIEGETLDRFRGRPTAPSAAE